MSVTNWHSFSHDGPLRPSFVFVASYNEFDNLAHAPAGTPSDHALSTYKLCPYTGRMTLLHHLSGFGNPGFLRYHPERNVLYACTESILERDEVLSLSVDSETGRTAVTSRVSSEGASACYLTLDRTGKNMLCVNYWDSAIATLPVSEESGTLSEATSVYNPPDRLRAEKFASGRADHLKNRQSESHAHAVVLDPWRGDMVFVPDLGLDVIRQFSYNSKKGTLQRAGAFPSGYKIEGQHGPRYIVFHEPLHTAYVVNELGSTVSIFSYDEKAAGRVAASFAAAPTTAEEEKAGEECQESSSCAAEEPVLKLSASIRTIPAAYDSYNCCGRIALSPDGHYLLVSNRGHNSIAVFRVQSDGTLKAVDYFHTRGRTPRHFQFDSSGRWLLVANQDTDTVAVFRFDVQHGLLTFAHEYDVASPNFVCVQTPHTTNDTAVGAAPVTIPAGSG